MEKHYYIFRLPLDLLFDHRVSWMSFHAACNSTSSLLTSMHLVNKSIKRSHPEKRDRKARKANNVYNMLKSMLY